MTVTSTITWFHPNHGMISYRIYKLPVYLEHYNRTVHFGGAPFRLFRCPNFIGAPLARWSQCLKPIGDPLDRRSRCANSIGGPIERRSPGGQPIGGSVARRPPSVLPGYACTQNLASGRAHVAVQREESDVFLSIVFISNPPF